VQSRLNPSVSFFWRGAVKEQTIEIERMQIETLLADQRSPGDAQQHEHGLLRRRTIIKAATAVAVTGLAGCGKTALENKSPTYVLRDHAARNGDVNSEYERHWPGEAAMFKLRDGLVLAIPPMYQEFWLQGNRVVRRPAPIERAPTVPLIGFDFFMPDFGGYTPGNYRQPFHEDRVRVEYVSKAEPPADGGPPLYEDIDGAISRLTGVFLIPEQYTDEHGLRCFASPAPANPQRTCVGERRQGERMLLTTVVPPYELRTTNPRMRTRYYTKLYGGMEVEWSAHMKWFPRWLEIEQQVWKFVDAWNIAK
jgi:hypothetical protein